MSGENSNFLDVVILGREYRVACPPSERDALLAAVAHVDRKMQDIAAKSKTAAAERVAVMAALNIAHELLSAGDPKDRVAASESGVDDADFQRRIEVMEAQLDSALLGQEPLF